MLPTYDFTETLLEDIFVHSHSAPPLVIVDWKVYCHDVHKNIDNILLATGGNEKKLHQLIQAYWAYKLNRGPDMITLDSFSTIVVDDCKMPLHEHDSEEASTSGGGYWRHIEAYKLGLEEYKGGRGPKPDTFHLVERIGLEYVAKLSLPVLSKPLFEADDIAGEIVRIKRRAHKNSDLAQRLLVLSTVDNDWSGLVSDEHGVLWANTGPWLPRLRSEKEVCDYFFRKEGMKLKKARECYEFKAKYGDASDNLPAGTPVRLFDLYEPDEEWNFSEEETSALQALVESHTSPTNRPDHLEKAERFIRAHGLLPTLNIVKSEDKRVYFARAKEARITKSLSALRGLRAKKICEQFVAASQEKLDKCIRDALELKQTKKDIESITEEIKAENDKEMLKELRTKKKNLQRKSLRLKDKLNSLLPSP